MGAVLLQAECAKEAEEAILKEIEGHECKFDAILSGLRLRPIAFISRRCKGSEKNYHSCVGEAATGGWAKAKFHHCLIGRKHTWITDCSGLVQFFEGEHEITHTIQRWRMELLAFNFTIVHRPGRMLCECDLLSRYESILAEWREVIAEGNNKEEKAKNDNEPHPIITAFSQHQQQLEWPMQFLKQTVTGPDTTTRTEIARICDSARATWVTGAGMCTIDIAMEQTGAKTMITAKTDENEYWQTHNDCPDICTFAKRLQWNNTPPQVEWLIVNRMQDIQSKEQKAALKDVIGEAGDQDAKLICLTWPHD